MKWITFDCFGTLVDWNGGFAEILRAVDAERANDLVRAYHIREPEVEREEYRSYRDVTRIALERAAQDVGVPLAAEQRTIIADRWTAVAPFDDTLAALRGLRDDGWQIGVLTNCDDDLFALTRERLGFDFDCVITAQQVRSYKPALAHFERFKETIADAEWVHAACSWFHDIEPASRVGIPRFWIDRDRTGDDPSIATAVLPDMRGLRDAVAQI